MEAHQLRRKLSLLDWESSRRMDLWRGQGICILIGEYPRRATFPHCMNSSIVSIGLLLLENLSLTGHGCRVRGCPIPFVHQEYLEVSRRLASKQGTRSYSASLTQLVQNGDAKFSISFEASMNNSAGGHGCCALRASGLGDTLVSNLPGPAGAMIIT